MCLFDLKQLISSGRSPDAACNHSDVHIVLAQLRSCHMRVQHLQSSISSFYSQHFRLSKECTLDVHTSIMCLLILFTSGCRSHFHPHAINGWPCCICLHVAVEAFVDTDQKYLQADSGANRDDGCTAVTAILVGQNLIVANVGDSRAVLSKGGQGKRQSVSLTCFNRYRDPRLDAACMKCCTDQPC